jgi:hypothetical protein
MYVKQIEINVVINWGMIHVAIYTKLMSILRLIAGN